MLCIVKFEPHPHGQVPVHRLAVPFRDHSLSMYVPVPEPFPEMRHDVSAVTSLPSSARSGAFDNACISIAPTSAGSLPLNTSEPSSSQ